jgi:hypothetical protein
MGRGEKATAHPGKGTRCGAKNRHGSTCGHEAGWHTDHLGEGRCRLHGGATPIKHGRYSQVTRARLGPALEAIEADPDPLNLRPELDLLRGLVEHHLSSYGPTPIAADLLERVARLVEAIEKHKARAGITLETLNRVVEQLGVAVARHVKDPHVLRAIEQDWGAIQLG